MKKIICVALCALMVLSLVACGGSKSVVGKWAFGVNTFEFNDDGTFAASCNGMENSGTYTAEDGKITMTYKSLIGQETTTELTYELSGSTLKLTGDVSLMGSPSVTVEYTKQ